MVINQYRATSSRCSISQVYRRGLSNCESMPQVQGAHEYEICENPRLHSILILFSVPYSGGTSLEANFSAPYGGMSIDFSFMDQIISLHADE
jgi:hypothetical protein